MIRHFAIGLTLAGALFAARPAAALIVAVDGALLCPELSDFADIANGGAVPERCIRALRYSDLYGPVGRAENLPGGPYVRVRHDKALYWAPESEFFTASGAHVAPPSPIAPPASLR